MKILLGKFTNECVAAECVAAADGSDPAADRIEVALLSYAWQLRSSEPPPPPPEFGLDTARAGAPIELSLGAEARATLERVSELQAVSAERIALHALLVHLAALDAAGTLN